MIKKNLKRQSDDTEPIKSKKKTKHVLGEAAAKDESEKVLEKLVLGGDSDILDRLQGKFSSDDEVSDEGVVAGSDDEEEAGSDGEGGEVDDKDGEAADHSESDEEEDTEDDDEDMIHRSSKKKPEAAEKKPVWEDEDDTAALRVKLKKKNKSYLRTDKNSVTGDVYGQNLKNEFEKVSSTPNWAKLDKKKKDEDSDSDEELLQSAGSYLSKSAYLPRGQIQMKKCPNANKELPSTGKLKSVEFHPTAQVVLTAGMNQTLALFQVDGKHNPKIQSIFLDKFPIHTAHFSKSGEEVIMGSMHGSFNCYDMIAGKVTRVPTIKGMEEKNTSRFEMSPDGKLIAFLGNYGHIHLVSARSKEWIGSMKMNGSVEAVAFNNDGSQMLSHGDDGQVYVWDMSTRQCIHRFTDDGCIRGTTVQVSRNNQYIACGSYSGVVNIYDQTCLTNKLPKPIKAVMNLTTPCTNTCFNSSTEILAIASNYTEKAVKLVHIPSLTVFSNFPDLTDSLRIPTCMDFSLNSGYLCIGDHKGSALLYRAKHYSNY